MLIEMMINLLPYICCGIMLSNYPPTYFHAQIYNIFSRTNLHKKSVKYTTTSNKKGTRIKKKHTNNEKRVVLIKIRRKNRKVI